MLAVRSIAARLHEVSDTAVKARALAELGDLLWKDDEPYARELFLRAYDLTKKTDQTPPAEARKLAALRKQILGPIAHRDPNLVKKLIEDQQAELTNVQRAETNLSIAYANADAHQGQLIFREAVKEFNQQAPEKLVAVNWNREITVGPLKQPFALKAKALSFNFEQNVQPLVDSDAESTMATIKTLTNEPALAAGLLAVAKTILK